MFSHFPLSFQMMSSDPTGGEEAGPAVTDEQTQPLLVSLSEASAVNMVVNMYELLNNSVTFISQDKPPHPGSEV